METLPHAICQLLAVLLGAPAVSYSRLLHRAKLSAQTPRFAEISPEPAAPAAPQDRVLTPATPHCEPGTSGPKSKAYKAAGMSYSITSSSPSNRMWRRRHPAKRHPLPPQLRNMRTRTRYRIPMHQLRRRARPLLSPASPRPRFRSQREASRPEVGYAQASTVSHMRYGPAAIIALNMSVHSRQPYAGRWARSTSNCFRK